MEDIDKRGKKNDVEGKSWKVFFLREDAGNEEIRNIEREKEKEKENISLFSLGFRIFLPPGASLCRAWCVTQYGCEILHRGDQF